MRKKRNRPLPPSGLSPAARQLLERERAVFVFIPPLIACPKLGYMNEDAAEQGLKRFIESGAEDPELLNTFPCWRCGRWHIGNTEERNEP